MEEALGIHQIARITKFKLGFSAIHHAQIRTRKELAPSVGISVPKEKIAAGLYVWVKVKNALNTSWK